MFYVDFLLVCCVGTDPNDVCVTTMVPAIQRVRMRVQEASSRLVFPRELRAVRELGV